MLSIAYDHEPQSWLNQLLKRQNPLPHYSENLLLLKDNDLQLKSRREKKRQFGFELSQDGVEIYTLFEKHWLIIASCDKCLDHPKAWLENRLKKAYECIPENDFAISLVTFPCIELEEAFFKSCYQGFKSLKVLIAKDSKEKSSASLLFHPLSDEIKKISFSVLDIESIKDYMVLTTYDSMNKESKQSVIHFSKNSS